MKIARARTYAEVARRYRLQIVVEDVRLGGHDGFKRAFLSEEVGRQYLDRRGRAARPDRCDALREMFGTSIRKIVPVDRGNDEMAQPKLEGRLCKMLRLMWIERPRHPRLDVAEGAGPGAGVAHDHEGRVLLVPALADIRTPGFLAHGNQTVFLDDLASFGISARVRRLHPNPGRFGRRECIGPIHLFRMARAQRRG